MASITISKRIRVADTDPWGAWATTTDAPPHTDTTLVQYKIDGTTTPEYIADSDLTNGSIITDSDNKYVWSGTGIFDKLMAAVDSNVRVEYDNGRIPGSDYAAVYLGALQSVIAQSVQYTMQKRLTEEQIALAYVNKIKADKEAALLGLDDAMIIAQSAKDGTAIYTSQYVEAL